tara:strand:- start:33 stop:296 length:264 start_codon:yes stop_codon:yes gene_type:complete
MPYLIFNSFEEATARSDQAGEDKPLPYHRGDNDPTRYMWQTIAEHGNDPRGALNIDWEQDSLTEDEKDDLVDELPADWTHPPNPFEQ